MPLPKLKAVNEPTQAPNVPQDGGEAEKTGPASPAPARTRPGEIAKFIPDDLEQVALEQLRVCMGATKRFWDKEAKDWVTEPDYASRIRAAELTLAYSQGRPVERKFELRGNIETFEERKEALLKSPEGVRFLLAAGAIGPAEASEALALLVPVSQG